MAVLLQQRECLRIVLHQRDAYTGVHCGRVEYLCRLLGLLCGLNSHERNLLRTASRLHDLGKTGIPDAVLLKPGRLDTAEWEVMKRHSELGQIACEAIPHADSRRVGRIVRHHHEAFDGSGYPDGLAGTEIPICSRIISLADSYDAMTTTRPYHVARTHEETMEIMRSESGTKSDPLLFGYFVRIIETIAGSPEGWSNNSFKPKPLRGSA